MSVKTIVPLRTRLKATVLFLLLGAAYTVFAQEEKESTSTARLVYQVENVTVRVMESYPEQLNITAEGTTRSGGWSHPQLRPIEAKAGKGVYEFEFVARPPSGAATMAITPIQATHTMAKPTDYKGVRVVAETNFQEAK